MLIETTSFRNLLVCHPKVLTDERGVFFESYRHDLLEKFVGKIEFIQDNESVSKTGVLRGLHFQVPPAAQAKLVRVISGSVLDVAVDLRKDEPTFGQHFKMILSGENKIQLFLPAGFAHGFYVLENDTVFSYKCSAPYNRELDRSLLWNDAKLGIDWEVTAPVISEKDKQGMTFNSFSSPF